MFRLLILVLSLIFFFNPQASASIYFDGADDFVDSNYAPNYGTNDNFSISVWVNIDNTPSGSELFISSITSGSKAIIAFGVDTATCATDLQPFILLRDDAGNTDSICSSTELTPGTWHHVAFTYHNANQDGFLYLDGQQVGSDTALAVSTTYDTSAADFYIGANHHSTNGAELYFDGKIEEVAAWRAELTATEVTRLAAKIRRTPLQVQPSSLEFYAPIDDGPNGTSADGDTVLNMDGGTNGVGNDGANNTGLTWTAGEVLSYP